MDIYAMEKDSQLDIEKCLVEFVNNNDGKCPACESGDVYDTNKGFVFRNVICNKCGTEWEISTVPSLAPVRSIKRIHFNHKTNKHNLNIINKLSLYEQYKNYWPSNENKQLRITKRRTGEREYKLVKKYSKLRIIRYYQYFYNRLFTCERKRNVFFTEYEY